MPNGGFRQMTDFKLADGAWDTHCHIFPDGFSSAPNCPPAPQGATLTEYRAIAEKLGITRAVVVQPNAYGADNAALIATLNEMGAGTIGIAAVLPGTPREDLDRLHDAGVRGARIMNLGGGAVPLAMLADVLAMIRPLNWVPVVQFDGSEISKHMVVLEAIDTPWVLDHYGKFLSGMTPSDVDHVKRLMDTHCTIKFAAHYEASQSGAPAYEDINALATTLITHRPDRVIWGSNWPHLLNGPDDKPDDSVLVEDVLSWIPEEHRVDVFVNNAEALFG